MKWKLSLAALILMLLLGGYSIGAWMMLRGAGAYRLGTSMGQILAASWQYTALAAVLLLLILGIPRLRKLLRYGIKGSLKNDNGKEDKIPPASGTIPMAQEDKIPPASGTIPMPQEDKIPSASGTIPMAQKKEDDTSVCPNCGAPCGKNQKFCTRCGTRLKEENP